MAPDGERIAVTDAQHVWFVELAERRVVAGAQSRRDRRSASRPT